MKAQFSIPLLRSLSVLLILLVTPIFSWSQSIVINEISQGPSGAQEYVEFLVTGPNLVNCDDTPPCLDLRLWIFDDNNGNLNTGGPQTGVGIAAGACRFSNDPFWSCVPAGTIIVIYNDADPNSGLPANDINMGDGNCTLVVPISSNLFEHHPSLPSATDGTYPVTGWLPGGNWSDISMANGGDGFQIMNPANTTNPVHSVGWDEADLADIYFTSTSMSGDVVYATDCNYLNQASWVEGPAASEQTPGAPNNASQADCIGNMNANCNPPTVVVTTTPETCLGDCDGTATATVTGGTPPYIFNWSPAPGAGQGTANATGICSGPITFTLIDDNGSGCQLVVVDNIAAGPVCPNCFMTNLTANVSACDPISNSYSTTGVVEFTDPPTTGTLIVEDCNGNQDVFTAPFTSPTNYTITGQNPDGGPCDITAYFSDDPLCTINVGYVAPVCLCNIDVFNATIGLCDQLTNTYQITGDVTFTSPPAGGTLIVEVNNGTTTYDTIINPPFSSPQTFSISGIPADGSASSITVYFSNDPGCSSTINFTAPLDCSCNVELGTFTANITGSSMNNYVLCFGDQIDIVANGDFVPADEQFAPPGPVYDPGISWLIYSCPPTVGVIPDPAQPVPSDPCFLGLITDGNFSDLNDLFWINAFPPGTFTDNIIYWVPITMYSQINGTYSYVNGTIPCYELGAPYAVQYLPEFTSSHTEDCLAGTATVTVNGGQPAIDGSNFTASNLLPVTASFVNTTASDGGTITISGLQGGEMWSFDLTDDNGCPYTVTGGPFPPLEDPSFAFPQGTYCTDEAPSSPVISGTAGGNFTATPAGLTLNGTSGQITPATSTPGTYNVTYTTPGACFDDSTVQIVISPVPTVDPILDQTICHGDNFVSVIFTGTNAPTFNWTNDNTNIGLAASGSGDIVTFSGTAPTVQEVSNIVVTPTTGICTGPSETFVLTVNPLDDASFSYPQTVFCTSDAAVLPVISGTTGGNFTSVPAGLNVNLTTGEITPASSTPGVYSLTYTTTGPCFDDSTITITIDQTPIVDPVANQTVCHGDNFVDIIFTGTAAATFNWTNDNTNIGIAAAGTGDILSFTGTAPTVQESGNFVVTPTLGGCTGNPQNFTLIVNPLDDAGFNYPQTSWCTSEPASAPVITGTAGGNFTSTPAGLSINNTTGLITPGASTPGTYNVTYMTTGACPDDSTIVINIAATPSVNPITDQTICDGDAFTDIIFTGSAGTTFNWTNDNTNIGLAASGTADILAFNGTAAVAQEVANIVVTPVAGSCTGLTESFVLTVNPLDDASFSYAQTSWCTTEAPMSPTISGSAGGTFTSVPVGLTLDAVSGQITPATSTPGTYDITYSTAGICPVDSTISVNIAATPSVDPIPDQTICDGDAFVDIIFTGSAGSTFAWTNDNTNIGLAASGNGDILAFTGTAPLVQEVANITVTPSAGSCIGTPESFSLTVNPLDDASFNYPLNTLCTSEPVQSPVISGTPGGSFSALPAGLNINGTTGDVEPSLSTAGTYDITYTTAGICPQSATFQITIHPVPDVNAVPDQTICLGDNFATIVFSGSVAGTNYDWTNDNINIGLGASGTGDINGFAGMTTGGVETASITVTPSTAFCVGTPETFTLTVNPLDDASFDYPTGLTYCQTGTDPTINITGLNGGTFSYVATSGGLFLDIDPATGDITLLTSNLGVYDITYNTAGAVGSICPQTSTLTITITDAPVADFTLDLYCANDLDPLPTFINGGSGGTFSSAPAGLSINPGTGLVDLDASVAGTYTVTNTINVPGCAIATYDDNITIFELPNATIAGSTTICPSDPLPDVTIDMTAGAADWDLTYNFNGNAINQTITTTPFTIVGATFGTYDLITVTDGNGCTQALNGQVVIDSFPTPTIDPMVNQAICEGDILNVQAFNGSPAGNTYDWINTTGTDVGFGLNGTGDIGSFTGINGTTSQIPVNVEVTPTSVNGCVGAPETFLIIVNPVPVVSFTGNPLSGCEPLYVEFTNTTNILGQNCEWSFGDGNTAVGCGLVSNIYNAGLYDVSLTVTTNEGCSASVTYTDYVNVAQQPVASFSYDPQEVDVEDTEVNFTNNSLFADAYIWDFGDQSAISTVENPSHYYPQEPNDYTVTLIAYDMMTGCADTAYAYIPVDDVLIFYVPNVMTPDGDIYNEMFKPVFTSGFDPFDYHLTIFNRWGEIIFESYNADKGWNGHYGDGGLVQDGVYVWQIEFKESMSDKRHTVRGHVTVLK